MAGLIQHKRGTAAQWTASNPILAAGEKGVETDTGREKNGNGVTAWNDRPYVDAVGLAELAAESATSYAAVGVAGPTPLINAVVTAEGSTPRIVDYFSSAAYGTKSDGTIWRSTDDGATWTQIATGPVASYVQRIIPCADGEVLLQYSATIRKSVGWAANPATAAYTTKVTANSPAYFLAWGFDGDGTKFIATEYAASGDWAASNNAWVSINGGDTWTVRWDQASRFSGEGANSHCHACCYDPWADRFFLSEGHGVSKGVYWSDDDGVTWTEVAGSDIDGAPTVMVATNDGIVLGSDSDPNGLFGIVRRTVGAEMQMLQTYKWNSGTSGLVGFAQRGFRDPRSGLVYIGFNSNFSGVKPVMLAGSAVSGGLVWEAPTAEVGGRIWNQVVTTTGKLICYYDSPAAGSARLLTAVASTGGFDAAAVNAGNILGATAGPGSSIAIGKNATTGSTAVESVVIGTNASATSTGQSVVIGDGATAPATCVAIGDAVSATGAGNVIIGQGATVTGTSTQVCVVVGQAATANLSGNTAIGQGASATNSQSTAIGRLSSAAANDSVALGRSSSVPPGWNGSVALGASTTVTAASQIQIGAKHVELTELAADAAAGAANSARLYVKDNGSGKTQLVVRFASGAVQVIATEP